MALHYLITRLGRSLRKQSGCLFHNQFKAMPIMFVCILLMWLMMESLYQEHVAQTVGGDLGQLQILSHRNLLAARNYSRSASNRTEQIKEELNSSAGDTLEQMIKDLQVHNANRSKLSKFMDEVMRTKGFKGNESKSPNPHPFKYIINNPNICKGKNIFLICYVHTAPTNYERRAVIRKTWGNPENYQDVQIQVVFVVGNSPGKPEVQRKLEDENVQYHDIIEEDFKDDYHNLTYKGVAALKWISLHCRNAKFVLKTDDDIFINMFTLLTHLTKMDSKGDNRGVILCIAWYGMPVMRSGKWNISKELYAGDDYPAYCSGSAYTMSTDVAVALHHTSYYVPFFWVDDVYHTGFLPLKLGIQIRQFRSTYVLSGRDFSGKFTGPQWTTYIFSHVNDMKLIQSVWHRIVNMYHGWEVPNLVKLYPGEVQRLGMEQKTNKLLELVQNQSPEDRFILMQAMNRTIALLHKESEMKRLAVAQKMNKTPGIVQKHS